MNAKPSGRVVAFLVVFVTLAVMAGFQVARLEPGWLIAGVVGAVAVGLVFYDYRVGVVCLTMLLPWSNSAYVPQTYGFNLINFLAAASIASIAIRKFFRSESGVWLPRLIIWCYLVPIALAVFVAWPHLSEGAANFPYYFPRLDNMFAPVEYMKSIVIKPMLFVVYALLVANAVRDSKTPEFFFLTLGLSALVPALAIVGEVISGGDVMKRDSFLSALGLHVNEYGMVLALAVGPLLFMWVGSGPKLARLASGVVFCIVSIALMLTASRGAAVAYIVIISVWLLKRRKLTDLILVAALATALVFALPGQVQDRLSLGLTDAGQRNHGAADDVLTMGRLYVWEQLAPDFWLSPIWGRGLNSTAWNSAVTSGRAVVGHPHNLYLTVLLDAGIVGFTAFMYLCYRYGQALFRLSSESSLSPMLRDYFFGAFASFLGMLAFSMTAGYYRPHPEQTYLWFALGFAFSYWHLAQTRRQAPLRGLFDPAMRPPPLSRAEVMPRR